MATTELNDNQEPDMAKIKLEAYDQEVRYETSDDYLDNQITDPNQQRLNALRATIHTKGSLLSTTWNDLYKLLSQYQAELFITGANTDADVGSDTELKREIYQKDSLLQQLQQRLTTTESIVDNVRLDLSVKNSLLKKYQDDLLEKEAALLTCQATIRKLENKQRILENRILGKAKIHDGKSPRQHSSQLSSSHTSIKVPISQPNTSHLQAAKPSKGSLINASISAISQKRKAHATHTPNKRKSTPPSQAVPQQVVSLADDEDIQDILSTITASDANEQIEAYMTHESGAYSNKNDNASAHSLTEAGETVFPGVRETGETVFPCQLQNIENSQQLSQSEYRHLSSTLGQMADGEADALEQSYENWQNESLSGGVGLTPGDTPVKKSPRSAALDDSTRRFACPQCHKTFTRPKDVKRHVNTVHLKLRSYGCPGCDKRFTRKEHSLRHMARCLGSYGIPYHASMVETIYNTPVPSLADGGANSATKDGAHDVAEPESGLVVDDAHDTLDSTLDSQADCLTSTAQDAEKVSEMSSCLERDTTANDDEEDGTLPTSIAELSCHPCHVCGRVFTRGDHRNRHIESVHLRIKKFECPKCGRTFTRKDHLTTHGQANRCSRRSALHESTALVENQEIDEQESGLDVAVTRVSAARRTDRGADEHFSKNSLASEWAIDDEMKASVPFRALQSSGRSLATSDENEIVQGSDDNRASFDQYLSQAAGNDVAFNTEMTSQAVFP